MGVPAGGVTVWRCVLQAVLCGADVLQSPGVWHDAGDHLHLLAGAVAACPCSR